MAALMTVVLWLIFLVTASSSFLYGKHHDNQMLGIFLSKTHAQNPDVRKAAASFQRACFTVAVLSGGCSLLLQIPAVSKFSEFLMILLVMVNFFSNWCLVGSYQKKLVNIKKRNHWTYSRKKDISVDLAVSREKGKSSISSLWVWLFFLLSFAPSAVCFLYSGIRRFYRIALSLTGPLCQLGTVFLYYRLRTQHFPVISESAEINLMYARQKERINSISATLSSLAVLVFWILFSFLMLDAKSGPFILAPLIFLTAALLIISHWQQKKAFLLEESLAGIQPPEDENIPEQQSIWKWGCYDNPRDFHLFVPKRIAGTGWTINIGQPLGKVLYFGIIILVFAGILFLVFAGQKDYEIKVQEANLTMNASFYDTVLKKDQVISVSVVKKIPSGVRTNGYSGIGKCFGHFSLDHYGKCMLYLYKGVDRYIVLQLKEKDPGYIIINDKTEEKTEVLYHTIRQWLSN